ncbi:glycosyltransferase 87 family protein [Chryseolinea sp. H1M3-3]|uniref:glycosyltransferase 87 family protein n=1 Tax=Chryseolinea sp. H1M3-3 TaxID=3034144 RepID=UPI0023EAFA53|nr:glycosyltransferase 87 family protein [Chryseolinea sp. H1M3-3]
MLNGKATQYLLGLGIFSLYFFLGYSIQRHETALLLGLYGIVFLVYAWIIFKAPNDQLTYWTYAAIACRLILLFSVPNLSEDFYRFIWDGRLIASGYHPFAHIPSFYIENKISIAGIDESLYQNLNSKNYFTVYPPVAQFLFWLSAKISHHVYGSLLFLKTLNVFAEIVSIFLLRRLISHFKIPQRNLLVYALNPLVILELSGNAHFEAIMIVFLLASIYFIARERLPLAAITLAIAICTKLIPLIFLPAILTLLGWKKAVQLYAITGLTCIVLFIPLLDVAIIEGFQHSLGYYFSRFEFNASIYYLVRWLGFLFFGYNIVHIAGGVLGVIATFLIIKISIRTDKSRSQQTVDLKSDTVFKISTFIESLLWALMVYFLFTTTLHPWYVTTLLAISVLTRYKFVVLWSFTIFLSYAGYSRDGFNENLWIVAFEYITVLGYLGYELLWKKRFSLSIA